MSIDTERGKQLISTNKGSNRGARRLPKQESRRNAHSSIISSYKKVSWCSPSQEKIKNVLFADLLVGENGRGVVGQRVVSPGGGGVGSGGEGGGSVGVGGRGSGVRVGGGGVGHRLDDAGGDGGVQRFALVRAILGQSLLGVGGSGVVGTLAVGVVPALIVGLVRTLIISLVGTLAVGGISALSVGEVLSAQIDGAVQQSGPVLAVLNGSHQRSVGHETVVGVGQSPGGSHQGGGGAASGHKGGDNLRKTNL